MPLGIVAILAGAALIVGPPDDQSNESITSTSDSAGELRSSTSGPETISDNATNPPQADLNGDTECVVDGPGLVTARGTLTNRSAETSSYMIQVSFNDEAGVRFAEAPTFHSDVRAGETVRWDATAPQSAPAGPWTCEVVSIERFSSQ